VSPDINVYATYATGYRAGGASSRSLTYRSFGPEEVKSYELGLKSEVLDRLRLNLAVYRMERTDSQIDFTLVAPDPITGASRNTVETVNAPGVTKIRGVELDATLQVTSDLRLTLAYAYTDTDLPPATNPFTGVVQPVYIIYTPNNVVSAAFDYTRPLGFGDLRLHLDANYADGTQSFEQFAQETDASFIVNARLALADLDMGQGRNVTFALWSRNLLDEEHIYRRSPENRTGSNAIGDYANFNEPRTYGAEVSLRF
jgi:iron complex outermembrane receptor protein